MTGIKLLAAHQISVPSMAAEVDEHHFPLKLPLVSLKCVASYSVVLSFVSTDRSAQCFLTH